MSLLPLTRGYSTWIDDADDERVSAFSWYAAVTRSGRVYATRTRPERVLLHRFLIDAPQGIEVDHIDGNTLNNRRSNLRLATHGQNQHNQRVRGNGYKGVYAGSAGKRYARIVVDGKPIYLGSYATYEEDARAYDSAAIKHFGEFAQTNFPRRNVIDIDT